MFSLIVKPIKKALCQGFAVIIGALLGTNLYAGDMIFPYFYQNAGKLVYENESFSLHQLANDIKRDDTTQNFSVERKVCTRDVAPDRRKSDVFVAVAILNLPPDAAMTKEWLWSGFRKILIEESLVELCPNAFVAYVDLYISGWSMTRDGKPYEVGQFGEGTFGLSTPTSRRYRTEPVRWAHPAGKGFGLGIEHLAVPVASVRFLIDETFSFESVGVPKDYSHLSEGPPPEFLLRFHGTEKEPMGHPQANRNGWISPFDGQGDDQDLYSYYSHFNADGSFIGRVQAALEQAERDRVSREEFEKMMIARDVALSREVGTANSLTYSLAWALSKMVEQWPSLAEERPRGIPRSSPCHFGNPSQRCQSLALQDAAVITMMP